MAFEIEALSNTMLFLDLVVILDFFEAVSKEGYGLTLASSSSAGSFCRWMFSRNPFLMVEGSKPGSNALAFVRMLGSFLWFG